jgi:hypothetical protein
MVKIGNDFYNTQYNDSNLKLTVAGILGAATIVLGGVIGYKSLKYDINKGNNEIKTEIRSYNSSVNNKLNSNTKRISNLEKKVNDIQNGWFFSDRIGNGSYTLTYNSKSGVLEVFKNGKNYVGYGKSILRGKIENPDKYLNNEICKIQYLKGDDRKLACDINRDLLDIFNSKKMIKSYDSLDSQLNKYCN